MNHIWEPHRDVCFACGRTRREIVDRQIECDGKVTYREWLHGLTFIREPIINRNEHDG